MVYAKVVVVTREDVVVVIANPIVVNVAIGTAHEDRAVMKSFFVYHQFK